MTYCMLYEKIFTGVGEIWFEAPNDTEAMHIAKETCKELRKAKGLNPKDTSLFTLVKLANITLCKVLLIKPNKKEIEVTEEKQEPRGGAERPTETERVNCTKCGFCQSS